jgi:hypothetical protein
MKSQGRHVFIVIICADVLIVIAILVIRLINSRSSENALLQNTSAPEVSQGMVVSGSVRNPDGTGMENVAIYAKYADNAGKLIATTDAAGNYRSEFYAIPGVEMITVWAQQSGVFFQPGTYYWRHPAGYEIKKCDFIAQSLNKIYFPLIPNDSASQ